MITKIEKYEASWCGPCKAMNKHLSNIKYIEIVKIDITENEEMATEKGIRSVPTLIYYDENGEEKTRTVGAISYDAIMKVVNNFN